MKRQKYTNDDEIWRCLDQVRRQTIRIGTDGGGRRSAGARNQSIFDGLELDRKKK